MEEEKAGARADKEAGPAVPANCQAEGQGPGERRVRRPQGEPEVRQADGQAEPDGRADPYAPAGGTGAPGFRHAQGRQETDSACGSIRRCNSAAHGHCRHDRKGRKLGVQNQEHEGDDEGRQYHCNAADTPVVRTGRYHGQNNEGIDLVTPRQ